MKEGGLNVTAAKLANLHSSLQESFPSLPWEPNFELMFKFNMDGFIVKYSPEASVLEIYVLSWGQALSWSLDTGSGSPV